MNDEMTPPQLPKAIWMAIPAPLLVEPPMLFPFHITMIGIIGYLQVLDSAELLQESGITYTPHAAKNVPMYWTAGVSVERRRT